MVLLQDLLSVPKSVHALVIISALTNLITSKFFDYYDQLIDHCRNTFTDVLLWLQEGREAISGFAETVSLISIYGPILALFYYRIPAALSIFLGLHLTAGISHQHAILPCNATILLRLVTVMVYFMHDYLNNS